MSKGRKPPSYLRHRGSDGRIRARTVLTLPGGIREERSLGPWGSPESHAAHERAVADWRTAWAAADASLPPPTTSSGEITIAEVCAHFTAHAQQTYRNGDGPKAHLDNLLLAMRPLARLYGHTRASEFGPKALKALRKTLADGSWQSDEEKRGKENRELPIGWSRKYLNNHVKRIQFVWRWAESEELLPAGAAHHLATVRPLEEGALGVRETDDVPPAPEAAVEAVLAYLDANNPIVAALVRLQLLTGARPGELVRLRPCDFQRGGKVELAPGWEYDVGACWAVKLKRHKTAHKNHRRIVLFGPQAQLVLAPFLDGREADTPLFSPRAAMEIRRGLRRSRRQSPVQPSQVDRSNPEAKRRPGAMSYNVRTYQKAIRRACQQAGAAHFHPHQLRHNAATRIVRQFGWEVARAVLGHRALETTRLYGLDDLTKAADAVGKTG